MFFSIWQSKSKFWQNYAVGADDEDVNGSDDENVATYKEQLSSQHHQDLKKGFS